MTLRFATTLLLGLCIFGLSFSAPAASAASAADAALWTSQDANGTRIRLYFFWTRTCPHCQNARPFVDALAANNDWLEVESLRLDDSADNIQRYRSLAAAIGEQAYSVPAFLFCGRMSTGFDSAATTGSELKRALEECRSLLKTGGQPWADPQPSPDGAVRVSLPILGDTDLRSWSLPLVTVILAAVDSFNPCAFFVLLFLLSLLVNAKSRMRMMLIGGLFVTISGLIYFLFMAAWLNVFLLFGELRWITLAAGMLALCFGGLNLKDYFRPGQGPSLSVPDRARPSLFRRMRALVNADSPTAMFAGTVVLAVLANSYELLCTAGFPMVFTRLLTLNDLSGSSYYLFLIGYCAVYVIPLLIIVGVFVGTLGRRKLSEREGRILKLLSGLMMTALGLLLLTDPTALNDLFITAGVIALALVLTFAISRLTR